MTEGRLWVSTTPPSGDTASGRSGIDISALGFIITLMLTPSLSPLKSRKRGRERSREQERKGGGGGGKETRKREGERVGAESPGGKHNRLLQSQSKHSQSHKSHSTVAH